MRCETLLEQAATKPIPDGIPTDRTPPGGLVKKCETRTVPSGMSDASKVTDACRQPRLNLRRRF